ncbi:MAG: hydantoinase B/oxoprolinase family protein [Candidatus Bipolaricaulota bacterium]|nr:hydantoinase B/oxoprolinase family protein [Candidatus Bipolaricaulota bacterium]
MSQAIDAITLEVLRHAFVAVAEEMNANLIRTAYSPNIKERRDCSSALFDAAGELIAQAESIPVHLGAMPYSVAAAIRSAGQFSPGDVVVVNDPYAGGAHLPDITFVAPVFEGGALVAFVANRAHHADVGGKEPGSLAGDAVEIYQEGLRIPPVRLWRSGTVDDDLLNLILVNVRTPRERLGDLRAQYAGCRVGTERVHTLVARWGRGKLAAGMEEIKAYSERRMRAEIGRLPAGPFTFEDALDDDGVSDGPFAIRVAISVRGDRLVVDFTGSSRQAAGPINAVFAVTASATYYAVRAATDPTIPPNAGSYRPIEIVAPAGTVVNPLPPAAVVGGNLETSQRIVDVVLGALAEARPDRAIAACQGTMNNVAIGGVDPRTGGAYTLYETIAGGFGARPDKDGVDGVHSHMTNTLRVRRYELIGKSGGDGEYRGGLGIRRDIEAVGHSARVSLLTERRKSAPYGIRGGQPGAVGRNVRIRRDGSEEELPGKGSVILAPGEVVSVRTPGGGGCGDPKRRSRELRARDLREGRA